ncbi:MAG: hypothetical protein ACKO6Q_00400 [Bacteroidota bacterium]
MKRLIALTLTLIGLGLDVIGQDYEKMSKKELKQEVEILKNDFYTLKGTIYDLETEKNKISKELSEIRNKYQQLEVELSKKVKYNASLNDSISYYRKEIVSLREKIRGLDKESISSDTSVIRDRFNDDDDFLNKYFFTKEPLNAFSCQLQLSKIILGDVKYSNNDNYYYRDEENKTNPLYVPEILDNSELYTFKAAPGRQTRNAELNQLVMTSSISEFNSKMPKIEIFKNKLLTIKYNEESEEAFLFNVSTGALNNSRNTLQIKLASEAVKADGTKNDALDIVWTILVIQNDCYLALSLNQLSRLNIPVFKTNETETIRSDGKKYVGQFCYDCTTTGNGFYFARSLDRFMSTSHFIDPSTVIYLFKLKQLK